MNDLLISHCPNCAKPLTDGMAQHCKSRDKPCGWVVHKCKATVDPRTGLFHTGR